MIKKFAAVLAITITMAFTAASSDVFAAVAKKAQAPATQKRTVQISPAVYNAVAKYKQHNYTGCIQDLIPIVEKNENDAFAQYYLGISYAQLGMKSEAQKAYNKVVELDKDPKLTKYSERALACLDGRPECDPNYVNTINAKPEEALDDMTLFIRSGKFMHDDVQKSVQTKELDKVKDSINNDAAPNAGNYKYINDASGQVQAQPTDEEIATAVRTLAKLGINPFGTGAMQYQNPEYAQISALLGNTNSNGSNSMNNYLPYLFSQEASKNPDVAKRMMQSMMLNQMMPNLSSQGGF